MENVKDSAAIDRRNNNEGGKHTRSHLAKALVAAIIGLLLISATSIQAAKPLTSGNSGAVGTNGSAGTSGGSVPQNSGPLSGAIFTSTADGSTVNANIYPSKDAVYLDGGPGPHAPPSAAGLPDGSYYVQVTTPDGTLLGTSVGSPNDTPVTVIGGVFAARYQLSAILIKASDPTAAGYDDTTNPGGVYKVWVSTDGTFPNNRSKTDNFIVKAPANIPTTGIIKVFKYYDANANGNYDNGDVLIDQWEVEIADSPSHILDRPTPASEPLAPGTYTVSEFPSLTGLWNATTATAFSVELEAGATQTVYFGNLSLGAGGGLTLGFWSNKNGQASFSLIPSVINKLVLLNLRDANGTAFDPSNYAALRTWLLKATATNMAYMLSAQLTAMELNVWSGGVSPSSLVYAPGLLDPLALGFPSTPGLNSLGYISIADLMAAANTSLLNGYSVAAGMTRSYQEVLKTALDDANNNKNFVLPASPLPPFSF